MKDLFIAILLLLLFLMACSPPPEPITGTFGEEVSLRVGQEVSFDNELRVKLLEVERDNRCSPGAECPKQGAASILLEVEDIGDQKFPDPHKMGMFIRGSWRWSTGFDMDDTDYIGGEPRIEGYEYVWGLCPYPDPQELKMPRQSDYQLYLRVRHVTEPVGEVESVPITVPCVEQ